MVTKHCMVPICRNNSKIVPDKYYIRIPGARDPDRRKKWLDAINVQNVPCNSTKIFICEDHFNLEQDMENWMYFKTVGSNMVLKKDVIPHRNIHKIDELDPIKSQLSPTAKRRKTMFLEEFKKSKEIEFVSVSSVKEEPKEEEENETEPNLKTQESILKLLLCQNPIQFTIIQSQEEIENDQILGVDQNSFEHLKEPVKINTEQEEEDCNNSLLECSETEEPQENEVDIEESFQEEIKFQFCKVEEFEN